MAVPSARLDRGEYLPLAYTPSGAVSAGDVVVQGDLIGVAGADIAASALGNLQIVGPMGVWIFPITSGSGTSMTVGVVLYWDATSSTATETAGSNKLLGKVFAAASDSDTTVKVCGIQQATP